MTGPLRANHGTVFSIRRGLAVAVLGASLLSMAACGSSAPTPSLTPSLSPAVSPSPTDSPSAAPTDTATPTIDTNPTSIPAGWAFSDLDGVAAPSDAAHRLPMAIMIDDNTVARPQSGFSSASIVYQAMADGGEDRYMMVFQEGTSSDIGPVRSARPYFVYWAAEYKPLYGHFGGDAESLQVTIPAYTGKWIYNEDDLSGGSCPYHRITTRAAPHNAYTNTAILISCAATRSYPATYQGLPVRTFVDDSPVADRGTSQTISIPYRTGAIGYQYEPATNSYNRLVDGSLQVDPANKQQVKARNIVVMFQSYATVSSTDGLRPVVGNVGTGKAIVFKEGKAIVGTWKKTANTALTRFYDASGAEIPLVRGQIYLQSVPIGTAVTY